MEKRKLRVGVIFGGQSGEHEVSLAGAASVLAAMDRERFEPVAIGITREGRWLMGGDPLQALSQDAARRALAEGGAEKVAMKDMFRAHGLPLVDYLVVKRHHWRSRPAEVQSAVGDVVGFPCFVKPANLGSSVGISKVKAVEELTAALDLAASHDRRLLVERAVQGREVEVAVLGNDAPQASLPGEVCYAGEWYDYETKYGEGHTTFKVPAPLAPDVTARVRELAIRAFHAIDGAGLARVDFFIENDTRVLVNEINTLPGFTATSAYPKLWEASGISYTELISRLIDLARERR